MKLNLSLGNLSLSSNGQLIKTMMFQADNSADSHGKQTTLNSSVSSKLLIGSDSTPMNMLETLSDWSLLHLLIDAISL